MLGRRTFIGNLATGAALVAVVSIALIAFAWVQQPARLPKVAILSARASTTDACGANLQASALPCFMEAMRDLGYVDGRTVLLELRFAEDDFRRLPAHVAELVRLRASEMIR